MRKRINNLGSSTVEAAFIFPLVLFIIVAFLFMAMYLYNVAKLGVDAHRICEYAEKQITERRERLGLWSSFSDDNKIQKNILEYGEELLSGGYLLAEGKSVAVDFSEESVKATVSLNMSVPVLPFVYRYIVRFRTVNREEEEKICRNAEKARIYSVLVSTGKSIKGMENAADNIAELIH